MSEVPETELPEHGNDPFRTRCAMLVSTLAMCLAIASLGGNNASKESMSNNILASNAYSFYQAKNVRQTSYKIAADDMRLQLANDKLSPAAKTLLEKKLGDYEKNITRYESEPETGEGKKELLEQAKAHEHERDTALRQDPWFDYAEALLQIAIVLTSVAILTGVHLLFWVPCVLGILGILSTINGFMLLV
jgi:thiol:disulfide interchange protein